MTKPNFRNPHDSVPVDLEIRVTTPWGQQGQRLEFLLNSPSRRAGFHHKLIRGREVHSPEEFKKKLFGQLEHLTRGLDVDGQPLLRDEILPELESIGRHLFRELFSGEMHSIYRDVREKIGTLLITTDESWIPWEILHPSEEEDDDEDFLCMKHQMSRWLTGENPLASDRHIRRFLCVEAGEKTGLQQTGSERRFLEAFARRIPGLEPSIHPRAEFREVVALLEEESFDLLHFSGHGQHDPKRPGEAKIVVGTRPFKARHLSAKAEKKLRQERPAVFFNACEVGQSGQSLTQLDGWAQRWVHHCGCSAFLAPAWSVRDGSARRFAEVFYEALLVGHTLGQSVFQARHALRRESPGDTAWLGYRLYGPPNAHFLFGSSAPAGSDAAPQPAPPIWTPPPRAATTDDGKFRGETPAPLLPDPVPQPKNRPRVLAAASIALVIALGWAAAEWRSLAIGGEKKSAQLANLLSNPEPANPDEPGIDPTATPGLGGAKPDPGSGETLQRTPRVPAPAVSSPITAPKLQASLPYSTMVPGKVAVLALDETSRQSARAIRSALFEASGQLTVEIPEIDPTVAQSLSQGSLPIRARRNEAPWGAEYVLMANGSMETLPQAASHIRSVALALSAELIRTDDGKTRARSRGDTQTGTGITTDAALIQAAGRCLRPISEYLDQGDYE